MDIIEVHRKDADTFEVGKIIFNNKKHLVVQEYSCLLYTSPSPRDN